MKLALPEAQADALDTNALSMAVSQEGIYALNGQLLPGNTVQDVANALTAAANGQKDVVLVINAEAPSSHASVVRIMEAARLAGVARGHFAPTRPAARRDGKEGDSPCRERGPRDQYK